jgi:hypothetical protein
VGRARDVVLKPAPDGAEERFGERRDSPPFFSRIRTPA